MPLKKITLKSSATVALVDVQATSADTQLNLAHLKKLVQQSQDYIHQQKQQVRLVDNDAQQFKRQQPKKLNPKFCYPWADLESDLKINRLIEYSGRYAEDHDLPESTASKIRKILVAAFTQVEFQVEYDYSVGMIIDIPKLYYDKENGYYMGTFTNDQGGIISRVSKITQSGLHPPAPFSPGPGGKQVCRTITTEECETINPTNTLLLVTPPEIEISKAKPIQKKTLCVQLKK